MLGLTPSILGYELNNGLLITEFIEGTTPTPEKMRNSQFLEKVVAKLRLLHSYDPEDLHIVEKTTFDACRHFYHALKALNISYDESQASFWIKGMESFEKGYYENMRKAVCHGDLYHGNLLESLEGEIYLIDWEYSFFGYVIDDLGKLCSDDLNDEEIQFIVKTYWGKESPDLFLKLKQNVFLHELVHYFWCLIQAHNNPANASHYYTRSQLMKENLNRAALVILPAL